MARSRAVGAREPGQVREEAALSDTAHAPWGSLIGVSVRPEGSGTYFDDGCTVHLLLRARGCRGYRLLSRTPLASARSVAFMTTFGEFSKRKPNCAKPATFARERART